MTARRRGVGSKRCPPLMETESTLGSTQFHLRGISGTLLRQAYAAVIYATGVGRKDQDCQWDGRRAGESSSPRRLV
jgi:hypothetical protein